MFTSPITKPVADPSPETVPTSAFSSFSQQFPNLLGWPGPSLFPHLLQAEMHWQSTKPKPQRAISVHPAKISFQNTALWRFPMCESHSRPAGEPSWLLTSLQALSSVSQKNLPQEKPGETPPAKQDLKSHQGAFH